MNGGVFAAVYRRDLRLAWRRRTESALPLAFFLVAASLFPLGIGPEPQVLRQIAPGVVWVCALLAAMLSMPPLYAADHADGTLEQMALSPRPLALRVVAASWPRTGCSAALPLVVLAPLLGLQFGLPPDALLVLALSLLIGTPLLGPASGRDRRADAGRARRRRTARAAGAAAAGAGAGVRRRRGRRRELEAGRSAGARAAVDPRRDAVACASALRSRTRRCDDGVDEPVATSEAAMHEQPPCLPRPPRRRRRPVLLRLAGRLLRAGAAVRPAWGIAVARSQSPACGSASSSRRPTPRRARSTASSSSTWRRPGCRCSCTW